MSSYLIISIWGNLGCSICYLIFLILYTAGCAAESEGSHNKLEQTRVWVMCPPFYVCIATDFIQDDCDQDVPITMYLDMCDGKTFIVEEMLNLDDYDDVFGFDEDKHEYPSDDTINIRHMLREYERLFGCVETEGDVEQFESGPIEEKVMEMNENLIEVDGNQVVDSYLGKQRVQGTVAKASLELSDFFSRPVQIYSGSIASLADFGLSLDPWSLYLAEPSVRAKIKNYAYMRAKMKVKVTVSGTPFHLGKLLLAYVPFAPQNAVLNQYLSSGFAPRKGLLKYLSQIRGAKVMDVHDNEPLEMEIPFIAPNPLCRLFNIETPAMPAANSFNDFLYLGRFYVYSLNQVTDCSGSATAVNMYIYAHMEDVHLGSLSASPYVITTEGLISDIQTEGSLDERKVGPLQRFATNVSDISKALVSVPWISPYAKASEMISSGIASIAALFGWSVATINTAPHRMKNEPYQNACNTIGYDTGQRLTHDPMQEVTVDPHFFGTQEDELVIRKIASIESYLDTFSWTNASTPMVPLWKSLVMPTVTVPDVTASTRKVQPTALHFAAQPFNYWRGKIKFKLQVVCTQFHRGKFAIIFEPDVSKDALVAANLKLNKQYVGIVDISATQEFEFCVDWTLPTPWKRVAPYAFDTSAGTTFPTGANLLSAADYANGMIYIVPLTKLQSPNATGASINVFVSCDDLRVTYPSEYNLPLTTVWTEGDISMKDTTCLDLNPLGTHDKGIALDTFGEEVLSFRNLLKKFWESAKLTVNTSAPVIFYGQMAILPPTLPTPTANASQANANLFAYLKYAFLGYRGGFKKRIRTPGIDMFPTDVALIAQDYPRPTVTASSLSAGSFSANILSNLLGTLFFAPRTNAGIEFEVPYYSNNYFGITFASDPFPSGIPNFDPYALRTYQYWIESSPIPPSVGPRYLTESTAVAEDFTFGYFMAAPYYRSL